MIKYFVSAPLLPVPIHSSDKEKLCASTPYHSERHKKSPKLNRSKTEYTLIRLANVKYWTSRIIHCSRFATGNFFISKTNKYLTILQISLKRMKLFRLIFLLRFRQVFEWIFLHEEGAMRAS